MPGEKKDNYKHLLINSHTQSYTKDNFKNMNVFGMWENLSYPEKSGIIHDIFNNCNIYYKL